MIRSKEHLREMARMSVSERPQAMLGYAQALADLARLINADGLRDWDTIPVIAGAERLWPRHRHDARCRWQPIEGILFLAVAKHTRQFQAVQRADRRLLLKVVPSDGGIPVQAEALIREFVGQHLRGIRSRSRSSPRSR